MRGGQGKWGTGKEWERERERRKGKECEGKRRGMEWNGKKRKGRKEEKK